MFAPSGLSTVSYAKAALFCILLAARWVLARIVHHGKKHKSNIKSLSRFLSIAPSLTYRGRLPGPSKRNAPTVGYAEIGADCCFITAFVGTPMTSTVL